MIALYFFFTNRKMRWREGKRSKFPRWKWTGRKIPIWHRPKRTVLWNTVALPASFQDSNVMVHASSSSTYWRRLCRHPTLCQTGLHQINTWELTMRNAKRNVPPSWSLNPRIWLRLEWSLTKVTHTGQQKNKQKNTKHQKNSLCYKQLKIAISILAT